MKIIQVMNRLLFIFALLIGIGINPIAIADNNQLTWYHIYSLDDLKKIKLSQNIAIHFSSHLNPQEVMNSLNQIPNNSLNNIDIESVGIKTAIDPNTFNNILGKLTYLPNSEIIIRDGIAFQTPEKSAWNKLLKANQAKIVIHNADPSIYFAIAKSHFISYFYINNPLQAQALGRGIISGKTYLSRRLIIVGDASNLSIISKELSMKKEYYDALYIIFNLQSIPTPAEAKLLMSTAHYATGLVINFFVSPTQKTINYMSEGLDPKAKKIANQFGINAPSQMDGEDFSAIYDAYAQINTELHPNKIFKIMGNTFKATDPGLNKGFFSNALNSAQSFDPAWIIFLRAHKLAAVSFHNEDFTKDLDTILSSGLTYIVIQTPYDKNVLLANDKRITQWYTSSIKIAPEKIKLVSNATDVQTALRSLEEGEVVRISYYQINAALLKEITVPFMAIRDQQGDLIIKELPLYFRHQ